MKYDKVIPLVLASILLFPSDTCARLNGEIRLLGELVVTTACPSIRSEPYLARVDMAYMYELGVGSWDSVDLNAFERSITNAIAMALNECDELGKPLFAVERASGNHVLSTGGK